jgi:hypothetical protein
MYRARRPCPRYHCKAICRPEWHDTIHLT